MDQRLIAYGILICIFVFVALIAYWSSKWKMRIETQRSKIPARDLWDDSKCDDFSKDDFFAAYLLSSWREVWIIVRDINDRQIGEIRYHNAISATILCADKTFIIKNSENYKSAEIFNNDQEELSSTALASYSSGGLTVTDGVFNLSNQREVSQVAGAATFLSFTFPLMEGAKQIGVVYDKNSVVVGVIPKSMPLHERLFMIMVSCSRFKR